MEQMLTVFLAVATVIGAPAASYFASRNQAKAQRDSEEIKANGPAWSDFTQGLLKRVADLEVQNKSQANEMEELRTKIERLAGKYWASINHIRDWRRAHPDSPMIGRVPDSIQKDI